MEEILKQYNNFSKAYSDNFETQDEIGNKRFYEFLFSINLAGKRLLDVGCGNGSDLVNFEKMAAIPSGIDPSQKFINSAK